MARGGSRVGTGQKKIVKVSAVPVEPGNPLLAPPSWLPEAQQALWRGLAPMAIAQQTLTPQKVQGFVELCELLDIKSAIQRAIAVDGAASENGVRLLVQYTKLAQRVDATLARFRLTGDGRPDQSAAKKPTVRNPWAA